MVKTRNNTIDILRLLAAFSVICLHNFSGSNVAFSEEIVALTRFAVPLFFIFSGCFAAGFSTKRKWKQALKIFLLAICSNLAYLGIELYRQPHNAYAITYRLRELFNNTKVRNFIVFNNSSVSEHLWFLGALLYCILLDILFSAITKRLKNKTAALGIISSVLLLGGLVLYHLLSAEPMMKFRLCYYRNFFFIGLPFYLIGKLLKGAARKPLPGWAYFALITGSCALTLVEFKLLGAWELYIGSAVLAVALAHLALCHPLSEPAKPVRVLAWLGRYASLPIYIVHIYFLDSLKGAYYANFPWQYEFGLYHQLALFAFLISLAVGAAVGALECLCRSRKTR